MASSYVFRKIDGPLWQEARGACMTDGLKFLAVVEQLLRDWLLQRHVDRVTEGLAAVDPHVASTGKPTPRVSASKRSTSNDLAQKGAKA